VVSDIGAAATEEEGDKNIGLVIVSIILILGMSTLFAVLLFKENLHRNLEEFSSDKKK
jgi:hypothetical protein